MYPTMSHVTIGIGMAAWHDSWKVRNGHPTTTIRFGYFIPKISKVYTEQQYQDIFRIHPSGMTCRDILEWKEGHMMRFCWWLVSFTRFSLISHFILQSKNSPNFLGQELFGSSSSEKVDCVFHLFDIYVFHPAETPSSGLKSKRTIPLTVSPKAMTTWIIPMFPPLKATLTRQWTQPITWHLALQWSPKNWLNKKDAFNFAVKYLEWCRMTKSFRDNHSYT